MIEMSNEINLNGRVLAESNATGTESDPIVSRIRPTYTDTQGRQHIALIETVTSCITSNDGKRLDRIIQEMQDAIRKLGGVTLYLAH